MVMTVNPYIASGKMKLIPIVFVIYLLISNSYYTIQPSELGNVRRLGVVQYERPLHQGLHFKFPFIDKVDKIQISLTTIHIPPFSVTTIDNQRVELDLNFNYTIPENKVYHLMYEIGRSGADTVEDIDIESQIIPVVKDRTARIFSSQNMSTLNANRNDIQKQIEESVSKSVESLFGIEPHSLQIAGIKPSDSFMASNEAAVRAKNEAVAAENTKRTRQFEADQNVIKAKGMADASIEEARGRAESVRLEAEANKMKLTLEGEGQEARLNAEIKPFGNSDSYIQYLKAKAQLNWDGKQPQVISGVGSSTNLVLPINGSSGK